MTIFFFQKSKNAQKSLVRRVPEISLLAPFLQVKTGPTEQLGLLALNRDNLENVKV